MQLRRALTVSLLILFGGTFALLSQETPVRAPDSISVDVGLVSVDVTVIDFQGRSVSDRTRDDFEILEDGIPQNIRNFVSVESPYNVLFLLDCSESTRDQLKLLVNTMQQFVGQLRTTDRIAVAAFGSRVHTLLDWSADKKRTINFVDDPICRSTDFYGALDWSVRKLREVSGRRGVVVFSDGFHTEVARKEMAVNGVRAMRVISPKDDHEFQRVATRVRQAGSPFYFIAVDTDLNPGPSYAGPVPDLQQIRARLEQLADESGGRIVFPKNAQDVVPLFVQITRELGTSYSLAYTPSHAHDGKLHGVEVRVRGGNYQVHQSRKTYTGN
jgi:Ca-activated chloride channel family protein